MKLEEHLNELEERIESKEADLIRLNAELAGLRAERTALRSELDSHKDRVAVAGETALSGSPDLGSLPRTEAIVQVLGHAGVALTIPQVIAALDAGGSPNPRYNVVASTLNMLLKEGRVTRPERGRYAA